MEFSYVKGNYGFTGMKSTFQKYLQVPLYFSQVAHPLNIRYSEVFTLSHIFRVESTQNPSSPSTPAGIFPTSPSEIEVCSKHLNSAENVLMHSH